MQGYDPVAYVEISKAIRCKSTLAVYHQGANYYVSSVEYKELYK